MRGPSPTLLKLRAVVLDCTGTILIPNPPRAGVPGVGFRAAPQAFAVVSALAFLELRLVLLAREPEAMAQEVEKAGFATLLERMFFVGADAAADARLFGPTLRFLKLPAGATMYLGADAGGEAAAAIAAGMRAFRVSDDGVVVPGAHHSPTLRDALAEIQAEQTARHTGQGFSRQTRNLLADLRGLPQESSRSYSRPGGLGGLAGMIQDALDGDESAARGIASLAGSVVGHDEAGVDARTVILDNWPVLVGPKLRKVCFPVGIEKDALVVFTESPVARNELKFAERALVAAVRKLPGCSGVLRVVCRM